MLANFDVEELVEALHSLPFGRGRLADFWSIFSPEVTAKSSNADRFGSRKATRSEKEFPAFCSRSRHPGPAKWCDRWWHCSLWKVPLPLKSGRNPTWGRASDVSFPRAIRNRTRASGELPRFQQVTRRHPTKMLHCASGEIQEIRTLSYPYEARGAASGVDE